MMNSNKLTSIKNVTWVIFSVFFISQLNACSSMGVSDGSAAYQQPNVLPPLKMGDESSENIKALLPLPSYSAFSTTQNQFTNKSGKRFVMPRPDHDTNATTD